MSQTTTAIGSIIQKKPFELPIAAAEAFYSLFRALPRKERLTIVGYIVADEDIQINLDLSDRKIPNETTKQAFNEPKEQMAVFEMIDDLRQDRRG